MSAPAKGKALTDLSGCVAGQATCSGAFYESGTLTCAATVGGTLMTASATVSVVPCPPTGDSVLDSPEVRKKMLDAMAASNPNATPGTLTNGKLTKHEVPGVIVRRPDGSFYLKIIPDGNATECGSNLPGGPFVGDSPGDIAHWVFHTHPSKYGEPVYGCPKTSLGHGLWQTWCQSLNDGNPVPTADPMSTGGGSTQDWPVTRNGGTDMYILDKDGHVWILPADVAKVPVSQEANNSNVFHPFSPGGSMCRTKGK